MSRGILARTLAALAVLALLLGARPGHALVNESQFELPVEVTDQKGQVVKQKITVTVIRDTAKPKAPFLILNHGRAPTAERRLKPDRFRYSDNSRYFVAMGYAVFVPTRVGYGGTGGPDVENSGACKTKNYPPGYEAGAQQSVRLIEHVKTLPFVDPRRGLVVGQSYGGAISMALAAKNIPGVVGAVNFAGGGGGNPETQPGDPCRPDLLARMFATYATAKMPTLWLYSENDQYMGKEAPHTWFKAFTGKGGKGRFVQLPAHGKDGHGSFTSNPGAWKPAFEAFAKGL